MCFLLPATLVGSGISHATVASASAEYIRVMGEGENEGWFTFRVRAVVTGDGQMPHGHLMVDEIGSSNYDVEGRVVCLKSEGRNAVVAATRPESPTTQRVVFLALRDYAGTDLGPDRAAPAFAIVPNDYPLAGLCANAFWLWGFTEPLDSGDVTITHVLPGRAEPRLP